MAEVLIPPDIIPTEETIEIVDDATVVFRPALAGGLVQRQQFAAPRLKVTQRWQNLTGQERSRMIAVCSQLNGRANALRAAVGFFNRGCMPTTQYTANPTFDSSSNWTGASATYTTVTSDNAATIMINSGSSGITVSLYDSGQGAVIPASSCVVFRSVMVPGWFANTTTIGSGIRLSSGVNIDNAGQVVGGGYTIASAISSGAIYQGYARAQPRQWGPLESVMVPWGDMRPCLVVGSAESSGARTLGVKGASPTSQAYYLLAAGDWVEINNELHRLTLPLHTSSGRGVMTFEPPLVSAAAINQPVITHRPMGKFILAENLKWTNRYGVYADLELTFEEIYEP